MTPTRHYNKVTNTGFKFARRDWFDFALMALVYCTVMFAQSQGAYSL